MENLLPQNVGSIINYLQECTEAVNGKLLVAVNHNQLRTMASETVDPIDRSHPHPHGQYPLSASCIVYKSVHSAGLERATAACEATILPMWPLRVWFKVNVGLKQGCVTSPWLFNVYMYGVIREVNVRVLGKGSELLSAKGGRCEINQLLFGDDTALVDDSEEKLCRLVSELVEYMKEES